MMVTEMRAQRLYNALRICSGEKYYYKISQTIELTKQNPSRVCPFTVLCRVAVRFSCVNDIEIAVDMHAGV